MPLSNAHPPSVSKNTRLTPILALCLVILFFISLAWPGSQITAKAENLLPPASPASSEQVMLPMVLHRNYAQLPLGSAVETQPSYTCDTSYKCYKVEITCAQVTNPLRALVRVGEPPSQPVKGTILFFSGTSGTVYYSAWVPENATMLQDLRNAGYRTIEALWDMGSANPWYKAASGVPEGHQNLSCRPATLIQWVNDNLIEPSAPYCALGHSNGAAQLADSISFYNAGDFLKAAVMESGPNWSRVDQACLNDDPTYSSVWLTPVANYVGERNNIDSAYGQGGNAGPCYKVDTNYRQQFLDSSVAFGNWRYYFPSMRVSFLFGELDTGKTAAQGRVYYDRLLSAGTPFLSTQTVIGAGHTLSPTSAGATAIKDTLINTCVP